MTRSVAERVRVHHNRAKGPRICRGRRFDHSASIREKERTSPAHVRDLSSCNPNDINPPVLYKDSRCLSGLEDVLSNLLVPYAGGFGSFRDRISTFKLCRREHRRTPSSIPLYSYTPHLAYNSLCAQTV